MLLTLLLCPELPLIAPIPTIPSPSPFLQVGRAGDSASLVLCRESEALEVVAGRGWFSEWVAGLGPGGWRRSEMGSWPGSLASQRRAAAVRTTPGPRLQKSEAKARESRAVPGCTVCRGRAKTQRLPAAITNTDWGKRGRRVES